MTVFSIFANRGRTLEELFELVVAGKDYCYFQKQHNLWVPWKGGAFPATGSPIDFIGVVKGVPVAVECKEVQGNRFPFSRLPQKEFSALDRFEKAGGKAFLVVMQNPHQYIWIAPLQDIRQKYLTYLDNRGKKGYCSMSLERFVLVPDATKIPETLKKLVRKKPVRKTGKKG